MNHSNTGAWAGQSCPGGCTHRHCPGDLRILTDTGQSEGAKAMSARSIFTIKQGDTTPAIKYDLEPQDTILTGATARFLMRPAGGGATVLDASAQILSPADPPTLGYAWQAGDTDLNGVFDAEFKVTNADGTVGTYPNRGFLQIHIGDDIPDMV